MTKKGHAYKLVRDNIPNLIEQSDKIAQTRIITDESEKKNALFKKLREEVRELESASDVNREEELADILEVLGALVVYYDLNNTSVFELLEQKRASNGGFTKFVELKGNW